MQALDQPTAKANRVPLLALGVVLSLGIFAATFSTYLWRQKTQAPGSYLPLAIGAVVFFVVMVALHFRALGPGHSLTRLAKSIGIAMLELIAFLGLFLLILVNVTGS